MQVLKTLLTEKVISHKWVIDIKVKHKKKWTAYLKTMPLKKWKFPVGNSLLI